MTENRDESERLLAVAAQAGDRGAFERLVRLHKHALYRFARRYTGDSQDAYDIVQDTFVAAWLALHRYDERKSLTTWLRAIALNKCRDYGRRHAVRSRFLMLFASEQDTGCASEYDPVGYSESVEAPHLRQLDRAIASLPQRYKEPLLLTLISGLTHQAAAEQLGTTAKAIEMRVRRAKARLRMALRQSDDTEPRSEP